MTVTLRDLDLLRVETTVGHLYRMTGSQRTIAVLGNSISEKNTVWCADWRTGKRFDPETCWLRALPDAEQPAQIELLAKVTAWAAKGNADAAWWLGWWFEGENHAKSVWYYVAAIRREPAAFGWALERVSSDARSACIRGDKQKLDLAFLAEIPEFNSADDWGDWREAIGKAEAAPIAEVDPCALKLPNRT